MPRYTDADRALAMAALAKAHCAMREALFARTEAYEHAKRVGVNQLQLDTATEYGDELFAIASKNSNTSENESAK